MLPMFAEANSTTARLWLPTLPIMEGLKDITKSREARIRPNYTVLSVIYDLHAFVMQGCECLVSSLIFLPSRFNTLTE